MPELLPELDYSGTPYGNAATHVTVSAILLYIAGGIDLLAVPLLVFYAFWLPHMMLAGGGGSAPPPAFLAKFFMIIYLVMAVISVAQGVVKMIAATKLRRRSRGAWGWALGVAIASCVQLECSFFCVGPLALGIYMIIMLCNDRVRRYLKDSASGARDLPADQPV